jgi:hypothetical protein
MAENKKKSGDEVQDASLDQVLGGRSQALRDRIQAQMDQAVEAHRQELFRHRIELARGGVRSYSLRRVPEAVKSFHTYLKILEDWKKVPEGTLSPSLFDPKIDAAELLLISGVYWDLVKLYDRTKSAERYAEFSHFVDKYVEFTVGQPFQPLAAETVRKYIVSDKPVHMKEFKEMYKRIALNRCFVATALVEVQEEGTTPTLRSWRDQVLQNDKLGQIALFLYYRAKLGHALAHTTDWLPLPIRRRLGVGLDHLARFVRKRYRLE